MAASVASGRYADLREAARHMVRVRERLEPDARKKSVYDRKFALFAQAVQALDGLWSGFDAD
jgi:ribulose kinase